MIILDTHIWLWWINDDTANLGLKRKELIESDDLVAVSAISCFEVAWLERHKRIALSCSRRTWFDKALYGSGVSLLPVTPKIACIAVDLPEHHSDPQDRIIIATALTYDGQLMSIDRKFPFYEEIRNSLL